MWVLIKIEKFGKESVVLASKKKKVLIEYLKKLEYYCMQGVLKNYYINDKTTQPSGDGVDYRIDRLELLITKN
tara:strand:+ start:562 stop:780 length:219 start_codon:yes stop_codon:yes gene_type:complete